MPHHPECNRVLLSLTLTCPFSFHDTITESCFHFWCIRTILAMYLDTPIDGYESKDFISINRITTLGQFEIQSLQILVNDQDIVLKVLVVQRCLDAISFCTPIEHFVIGFRFFLLHLNELVENLIGIQLFNGNVLIEIGYILVSQLLDQTHHHGFIVINLSVLELSFDGFLGKFRLTGFDFFQSLANLGSCFRSSYNVQPITFRCLGVRGHDFHLVSTIQLLTQLDILSIYFSTDTF